MAIPIFVIQRGNSDYLRYCLHQARNYNPKSEIILIGDRSNNKYPFIKHYHVNGYSFNANIFAKTYAHMKINVSVWDVKMWFRRWFVLRDFMRQHNYGERFVYIDSDVLLFCNVTEEIEKFKDYVITTGVEGRAHCTFINGLGPLEELCDRMTDMFTEPDKMNLMNHWPGAPKSGIKDVVVNDSILISEFKRLHPLKVGDNSIILDGSTYEGDHSKSEGYEFDEKNHVKKIYWKDDIPYGKHLNDGNLIKFNAMHFRGAARPLMHRYYSGKNLFMWRAFSKLRNSFYVPGRESKVHG